MNNKILDLKQSFLEKQQSLRNAAQVLKTEFIGIDNIIDDVINNVNAWYCFPNLQEKPLIVNLWGLTGVGKTSLVRRLAQLIDFENRFYHFDMGKKRGTFSFNDALDDLCENKDTSPVIIALDEFQHARTIVGPMRQEVSEDHGRMVWELIDSGRVQFYNWKNGLWSFEDFLSKLGDVIAEGVKVENGYVVSNKELFCKEFEREEDDDKKENIDKKLLFIPESKYQKIIDFAERRNGLKLKIDVQKALLGMNEQETLLFLYKILKRAKRPGVKNFSKALIFILGNLDEAYTMSANFNVDIDADEFHRESLKINIPDIKKSLRQRFRDEQIARFGNVHIIYPAFNKENYRQFIKLQLSNLARDMNNQTDLKFEFEPSINEIIYEEGVYPTQGVRPIYTTINQLIRNNIVRFISQVLVSDFDIDTLRFGFDKDLLKCEYISANQIVDSKEITIVLSLNELRKPKQDNLQAITAVHESGHAIVGYFLLQSIPEFIYSVTTDSDIAGFTFSRSDQEYTYRGQIIKTAAMMLGGYAAEEVVFGKEYLTTGSQNDIDRATAFLSDMYKKNGMGNIPLRISIPLEATANEFHDYSAVEDEIKIGIVKAMEMAKEILLKEKRMLLVMSEYLSNERSLHKAEILRIIENEKSGKNSHLSKVDDFDFRLSLKQQLESINKEHPLMASQQSIVMMNKEIVSR